MNIQEAEFEGKTVDQAIEAACEHFGVPSEDLEVEIITYGSTGLFGLGGKKARIKARIKPERLLAERAQRAEEILKGILEKMDLEADLLPEINEDGIKLEIKSPDAGLIIGQGGSTLEALEYLVNKLTARQLGQGAKIVLDVEGYRGRHVEALEELARKTAHQVRRTGKSVTLKPMSARERRIIHLALKEEPRIKTKSIGSGERRRVVIFVEKGRGEKKARPRH
ncbi:RNA-binding cell elongation regulator Jag/EloR [Thermosulfuriphilus sp.]